MCDPGPAIQLPAPQLSPPIYKEMMNDFPKRSCEEDISADPYPKLRTMADTEANSVCRTHCRLYLNTLSC